MKFYKVLKNGKSFHGGSQEWPLPVDGKPGAWLKHDGLVLPCRRGFHVTTEPALWMDVAADVFEVETRDAPVNCGDPDKFVCREIRLVKKLDSSELAALNVFSDGEHIVSVGKAFAFGDAKLSLRESSSAVLRGSSSAELSQKASAIKWSDRSKQTVKDDAIVIDRSVAGKPKIIGEHQ